MKKILRTAMLIAASALLTVSCTEEDATPVPSTSSSATIRGFVFYDVDDTSDDDDQNDDIPVGASVQITTYFDVVDGEIQLDNSGEASTSVTTVGADGSYSFTIPTNADGADYDIRFFDFDGVKRFEVVDGMDIDEVEENGFYSTNTELSGTAFPSQPINENRVFLGDFTSTESPTQF